jgi:tetratricopeptide (TPR) repeat protein
MAESETSKPSGTPPIDHAKKWWWLTALVLPIALAIFNKYPFSNSPVHGTTYIASMTVIGQQYQQQFNGQTLDPAVLEKLQQANALAKDSNFQAAAAVLQEVAQKAPVPAVLNNLGVVYQGAGDSQRAKEAYQQALQKDPAYEPAKANLKALAELGTAPVEDNTVRVTRQEHEPNNEIFQANAMPLETGIAAAIADPSDKDTFQFRTPPKYRDWIDITVENKSTTLMPQIDVYNADKARIGGNWINSGGANLKYSFVAQPDSIYYAQISPSSPSAGAYSLVVKPAKAYDSYEPNDDKFHATLIGLGKTIKANIMDPGDVDCYQFKTSKGGNVLVSIDNQSNTLMPEIDVYNADKARIGGNWINSGGANLKYSFAGQPGSIYYVQISPNSPSAGQYSLTVTEQ